MWREQPGQQRLVDAVGVAASSAGLADLRGSSSLRDLAQLGLEVLPLPDPQVVEVLALAHPPERAADDSSFCCS